MKDILFKEARDFANKNGYLYAKYVKSDNNLYRLDIRVDTETPDDEIVVEARPFTNKQTNFNTLLSKDENSLWILYNTDFLPLTRSMQNV